MNDSDQSAYSQPTPPGEAWILREYREQLVEFYRGGCHGDHA